MFVQRQPPANVAAFRGPAYGLCALSIMPGITAFFVLQSLLPVLRNGTAIWLASILPVIGSAGLFSALFLIGLLSRQSWYSVVAQGFGWLLMLSYALGVGLGLAILVGLVPKAAPDLSFISIVNMVMWLLFSPLNLLLWRVTHREAWRRLPPKEMAAAQVA